MGFHKKFDDNIVGYCWDSGYEMCYNRVQDLLAKFGNRLFMTHINDNLGISRFDGKIFRTDDLYLLPFDGITDWDCNVERFKNSRHLDILNFELNIISKPNRHKNDFHGQMASELEFWLKNRNALSDYLAESTIKCADSYAKGKPWSCVIWDIVPLFWLSNKDCK